LAKPVGVEVKEKLEDRETGGTEGVIREAGGGRIEDEVFQIIICSR
jgi:hypothetical protein